jgi:uncharacterized protein (TIGR00251 family)
MARRKFHLHDGKAGSALAVRVTPRARQNRVAEVMSDGTVKIHIAAPPSDGEANDKLVSFLAEVLDVAKSRIEIVAGLSGRDKLVSVLDLDSATVHKRILAHLE